MQATTGLLLAVLCAGCITPNFTPMQMPRAALMPSVPQHHAFAQVVRTLSDQGFPITLAQPEAGIVMTDWRAFSVTRGMMGVVWPARERVRVLFGADGTATVSADYECAWGSVYQQQHAACTVNDEAQPQLLASFERVRSSVALAIGAH